MQDLKIMLHEKECWLMPEKALYIPQQSTLVIADLHIGKCSAFRQAGIAVPILSSEYDLLMLSKIIDRANAKRLIILGDFLHSRAAQHQSILNLLSVWREQHKDIEIILIKGNHDQHAGNPDIRLNIKCIDEELREPPWIYSHELVMYENNFSLAGHIHPVIQLNGFGKDKLRLPCFYIEKNYCILPAFGYFTGGYKMYKVSKFTQAYVIAEDSVIRVY